jgi:hypothetical protein
VLREIVVVVPAVARDGRVSARDGVAPPGVAPPPAVGEADAVDVLARLARHDHERRGVRGAPARESVAEVGERVEQAALRPVRRVGEVAPVEVGPVVERDRERALATAQAGSPASQRAMAAGSGTMRHPRRSTVSRSEASATWSLVA